MIGSKKINPYTFPGLEKIGLETLSEKEMIKLISEIFKIKVNDITGKYRGKTVVCARHYTCYIFHKLLKKTLTHTGAIVGCDHSTVLHACKAVNNDFYYLELTGKVTERLRPFWNELEPLIRYGTPNRNN